MALRGTAMLAGTTGWAMVWGRPPPGGATDAPYPSTP
jgi:hypothetical protein